MEPSLLNIADYEGSTHIASTFPVGRCLNIRVGVTTIGEVFTELKDLSQVSGDIMVWGFPNLDNNLLIMRDSANPTEMQPFRVTITDGLITGYDQEKAPEDFGKLLEKIKSEDGCVRVREFGLGLNRAMDFSRLVSNTTAFERQHGLHLSIGNIF